MAAEPAPLPLRRVPVLGYARKSTLGGGAEAHRDEEASLDGQVTDFETWCERQGPIDGVVYDLIGVRRETEKRYWLKGRSVLMGILEESREEYRDSHRADAWEVVLIWDATRFVGKAQHIGWLQTEFDETDVVFRYVNNDPGTGKFAGVIQTMQAFAAEQETDSIVLRVRRGKRDRHALGMPLPFPAPFGTVWEHLQPESGRAPTAKERCARLVADPTDAGQDALALVRRLYTEVRTERISATQLALRLARAHIPSPRGGTWTSNAVIRTLRNPAYRGDYVMFRTKRTMVGRGREEHWEQLPRDAQDRTLWPSHHEQFVPPAEWDAVQAILAGGAGRSFPTRTPLGARFLLTGGLARCEGCGRPLTNAGTWTPVRDPGGAFGPGDRVPYYGCSSARGGAALMRLAGRADDCPRPARIRADVLDRVVWHSLLTASTRPAEAPTEPTDDPVKEERRLTRELTKKRALLTTAQRKQLEAPTPERALGYETLVAAYEAEIRQLDARRQTLAADAQVASLTHDQRSRALRLLFEHRERLLLAVPWGDAPEQDAVMRSTLVAVGAQVVVWRRGGRSGARGGYAGLLRERPFVWRFAALRGTTPEAGQEEADDLICHVYRTTSSTVQEAHLATALQALPVLRTA